MIEHLVSINVDLLPDMTKMREPTKVHSLKNRSTLNAKQITILVSSFKYGIN